MDYLLLDNSKNQMCFKQGGQILLLRILLRGNSYKKCYKKWIFLAAFWRRASCSKQHQVTWRPFSIYGSEAVTFKCKCDTSKTTWDIKTYWDVIVITEDSVLASQPANWSWHTWGKATGVGSSHHDSTVTLPLTVYELEGMWLDQGYLRPASGTRSHSLEFTHLLYQYVYK